MYRYIKSFADTSSQIKSDLRGSTRVVMNHLIKIWLYPSAREQNHWKSEVAHALNDVPKMKGKNRFPKFEFLMKNTWNVYEDSLENRIDAIMSDMKETPIEFDSENLYYSIHDYFSWICENLSKSGIVTNTKVYEEIEKLRSIWFKKED